jgi:hypothetical protein
MATEPIRPEVSTANIKGSCVMSLVQTQVLPERSSVGLAAFTKKNRYWLIFPTCFARRLNLASGRENIIGGTGINQIFRLQKSLFFYKLDNWKSKQNWMVVVMVSSPDLEPVVAGGGGLWTDQGF